jgi:hypothetical protein
MAADADPKSKAIKSFGYFIRWRMPHPPQAGQCNGIAERISGTDGSISGMDNKKAGSSDPAFKSPCLSRRLFYERPTMIGLFMSLESNCVRATL